MNNQHLKTELSRFLEFSKQTRLTKADGISSCGYTEEELKKYPPDSPGIHPYWDDEMENIQMAESLIEWAETGVIPHKPGLNGQLYCKLRINFINYLRLNPQFEVLLAGEALRGLDILLALGIKKDWKRIYCYDKNQVYRKLIADFFQDERIVFFEIESCKFKLDELKEDNILMVLSGAMPHALHHFIDCPKIKMIIKEGVLVDQSKNWKEHDPMRCLDRVYAELSEKVQLVDHTQ